MNLKIYSKWRSRLLLVSVVFAVLIFLVEVAYFFIYYLQNPALVNNLKILPYLFFFLIWPTVFNSSILLIAYFLNKNDRFSEKTKNYVVALTLMILAGNTANIHYVFPPLLCLLSIPLFLVSLFGDKKLVIVSSLVGCFYLVLSFLKANGWYVFEEVSGFFKDDPNLVYNYMIGCFGLISSYIGSKVLISYQSEKSDEVIEHYRRQEELEKLLKLDSLTKLYNHSSIYEIIEEELKHLDETDVLTLAMIDIDNFKLVNDEYGHINGDNVLKKLSEVLKKYTSEDTICARYGGEEFSILFINKTSEEAFRIIEKIKDEFIEVEYNDFLQQAHNKEEPVTFSCGLTSLQNEKITAREFFNRADMALYQAKRNGKNCIYIFKK